MKTRHRILLTSFIFTFACFVSLQAQESKWVGKWKSNEVSDKENGSQGQFDCKLFFTMDLCSDQYAYLTVISKYHFIMKGVGEINLKTKNAFCGEWLDDGELKIKPNNSLSTFEVLQEDINVLMESYNGHRLSANDKALLYDEIKRQADEFTKNMKTIDLGTSKDGYVHMSDLKKRGFSFTKTKVETPYYMICAPEEEAGSSFEIIDKENVPFLGLVRGALYYPEKGGVEIGLFLRKEKLTPFFTRTYRLDGERSDSLDSELLTKEKQQIEVRKCHEYLDTAVCPISGNLKFRFSDGRIYLGEWEGKKPSGKGRMTFIDGSWKEGLWSAGNFVAGEGRLISSKTDYYQGGITGNLRDGVGLLSGKDGYFKGLWENGEFKKGIILNKGSYKYEGTFSGSSFLEGCCTFTNGNTLSGKWDKMKLCEGTVNFKPRTKDYSNFEGKLVGGILAEGTFLSKSGFGVAGNWNDRTSCIKLEITFPNGDKVNSMWDISTGQLLETTNFEYIWADGVKCSYVVGKKLKLTKPSYMNPDGSVAKSKVAKGRIMQTTDGVAYSISPISLEKIMALLEAELCLPCNYAK